MTQKGYRQRQACALAGIDPRVYRRPPMRSEDTDLRARLKDLSSERRRFGYRRLHLLLRREGWSVNWKKLHRIYKEERLTVCERDGRQRALGIRAPITTRQAIAKQSAGRGNPAGAEPAVESGLRLRQPVVWPPVPHPECDRRLQQGMSGGRYRHFIVGHPCRTRIGPDRRDAGISMHDGQR